MSLPTGTPTFLFTDIEDSTPRWNRDPAEMKATSARHHHLLREIVERHGGVVFKTEGDAALASFWNAPAALAAAVEGQRALRDEEWGSGGAIHVRMGLHSGEAEPIETLNGPDYSDASLNLAARVIAAAHGDQIILSEPARVLVRDGHDPAIGFKDLGLHRLKGLDRRERLFQVVCPDLRADFPPPTSIDSHPHNLPEQLTSFVGRESEIEELGALLRQPEVRLVTLLGPGGTGKTRLALETAAGLGPDFPDGRVFVPLDALTDPALVLPAIAQALNVREEGGRQLGERVAAALHGKRLLLLLDNFEQVLPAAGEIAMLLRAATDFTILATSRAPLGITGERRFEVPVLGLPDAANLPPLAQLTQYDAVTLFLDRAMQALPGFQIDNESAPAVAEICCRLEGLPLAIELAAARLETFRTPQRILTRLAGHLAFQGPVDAPERQQTMRSAIDWSYGLLPPEQQRLFRRLAIFAGGIDEEAAEAACGGDDEPHVIEGLEALRRQSLLRVVPMPGTEQRYRMLEMVREYAREQLELSGEARVCRTRHASHFGELVREAGPALRGPEQADWLSRLELEHDNLRGMLETLLGDDPMGVLALTAWLANFWEVRGYYSEGRRWLRRALEACPPAPTADRASALHQLGMLSADQGDYDEARRLYEESLATERELGDRRGVAATLHALSQFIAGGDLRCAVRLASVVASLFASMSVPGPGDWWNETLGEWRGQLAFFIHEAETGHLSSGVG